MKSVIDIMYESSHILEHRLIFLSEITDGFNMVLFCFKVDEWIEDEEKAIKVY